MVQRGLRIGLLLLALVVSLPLAAKLGAQAATTHSVAGSYTVLQTTESGGMVQLRLRLELKNSCEDSVSVEILGAPSAPLSRHDRELSPTGITLAPQGSETVTREITLSRSQYARWQADPRHRLALETRSSAGETTTESIAQRRIPGGKEE